jgi:hypothetical protein
VYNKVWASLTATSSSQLLRAGVPHVISVLGRTPGFLVGLDDYHNPHFDFSLLFEIGTRMPARLRQLGSGSTTNQTARSEIDILNSFASLAPGVDRQAAA